MLFLFNALVIGAIVMHVNTLCPGMQQTVALFVVGMIVGLVLEGLDVKEHIGVFGQSFDMWMNIDPHLLLFALLPALLAGDAMTIDTSVAKRVALQCLWMAGPGVIIQAMLVAAFLCAYFQWPFLLSLVVGSILCATDPVAVVALLKELGASPVLTVQIQGESLLNDGTAIVVYMIAYDMLKGVEYDVADVIMFLVQVACMAWALGMFMGYVFFTWIRAVGNRLDHNSSMIQIVLTLCCAYGSFIMAEGVFGMSGVLATVASSLVLAHHMWPHIVATETMHHVWHTFESLGNIVIFFLAGALTGECMTHIRPIDYLHLIVVYIVLLAVRALFVFSSTPLLRLLSADKQPVTFADATVMWWGGLRGAVGLALAIQVRRDRATNEDGVPQVDEYDSRRVLFFVSGIAFLTTIINATTAPHVVKYLGITALPEAQQRLMRMVHEQLVNWSTDNSYPEGVRKGLQGMLRNVKHEIDEQEVTVEKKKATVERPQDQMSIRSRTVAWNQDAMLGGGAVSNSELIQEFRDLKAVHGQYAPEDTKFLGTLPHNHMLGDIEDCLLIVDKTQIDFPMAKVVNKTFLSLVQSNYWKAIEAGNLRPGSDEVETLLTSIRVAQSPLSAFLSDYEYVLQHMPQAIDVTEWWKVFPDEGAEKTQKDSTGEAVALNEQKDDHGVFVKIMSSAPFTMGMPVAIVFNCLYVLVDENVRNDDNNNDAGWLATEAVFCVIFLIEFGVKFGAMKVTYFKDASNVFDFVLVILGVVGLIVSSMSQGQNTGMGSSEARIIRVARVFRILRFLRIFRLFHAKLSTDAEISLHVANHIQRMTTTRTFVTAHLLAQVQLVKYFGGNGKIDTEDESEMARCILQSQIACYKAITLGVEETKTMDSALVTELDWVYQRKGITEGLEHFVMEAHHDGALSAREAEAILHPLHGLILESMKEIQHLSEGIIDKEVSSRIRADRKSKSPTESPREASSLGADPPGVPVEAHSDVDLSIVVAEDVHSEPLSDARDELPSALG